MPNAKAAAYAPATMANLGVGFDILGLALHEPGDVVIAEPGDEPGAVIAAIEGDGGKLPHDPEKNTACVAANSVLRLLGAAHGVRLTLLKGLPLASGLGSSAASAVAAAMAVNALFGEPLTRADLLPAALDGEAAVSGYHPDNVAPCLFGGLTLCTGLTAADITQLPVPDNLYLSLVTPQIEVPTVEARAVLPTHIELKTMVRQTAAVARLIDSLHRGDIQALAAAMESDQVIEPARAHLMPLLSDVRAAAHRAGAAGLVISGAGPTLCAFSDNAATAEAALVAMQTVYADANIACAGRRTRVAHDGAQIRAAIS